jgi:hypothetical protein
MLGGAAGLAAAQEPRARSREEQHAIAVMITNCSDDQRQMLASGLRRQQYLLFCNCYVYSALDALDDAEVAYRREHGDAPSPRFVEISHRLVDACIQDARARLPE